MWHHPKYYKELRKLRNKSDQTISGGHVIKDSSDRLKRATGPGLKPQASSIKRQAPKASGDKHQAPSSKHQA